MHDAAQLCLPLFQLNQIELKCASCAHHHIHTRAHVFVQCCRLAPNFSKFQQPLLARTSWDSQVGNMDIHRCKVLRILSLYRLLERERERERASVCVRVCACAFVCACVCVFILLLPLIAAKFVQWLKLMMNVPSNQPSRAGNTDVHKKLLPLHLLLLVATMPLHQKLVLAGCATASKAIQILSS